MEDLDLVQSRPEHIAAQLRDLAAIGVDWDREVVRQSERFPLYEAAIERLAAADLVYECFCSRRDIRRDIEAAASAPHGPPGSYPGTCRNLTDAERDRRRRSGRPPALRLRTNGETVEFDDRLVGPSAGGVDDVVLRRNDGVPAYNLAVVVDDALQGVTEVVRGDDLLPSTPRQMLLQRLLGLDTPTYLHVPLVLGDDGERLAKSHGATTLRELAELDVPATASWRGSRSRSDCPHLAKRSTSHDSSTVSTSAHCRPVRSPPDPRNAVIPAPSGGLKPGQNGAAHAKTPETTGKG